MPGAPGTPAPAPSLGIGNQFLLTSVAAGLYPYVLPSSTDPALSLTIYNTAAARYGLEVGLIWFIPGMLFYMRGNNQMT